MIVLSAKPNKPTNPFKILKRSEGETILVKLKDGTEYVGKLDFVDNTMNIVLTDCTRYDCTGNPAARYDVILIRGSHVAYISLNYEKVAPEAIKK